MSDILIRGMEMPIRCINCPFKTYYHSENRCLANRGNKIVFEIGHDRGRDCPLVPLPEGHGKLIDADALIQKMCEMADSERNRVVTTSWSNAFVRIGDMVWCSPTVIEAEGGGEDG